MADVSRDSDRGQLFIVGALALSVLLVTLAVLLNTAIYTGNVATRDAGPGTGDVVQYEGAAESAAGELLTAVNYANDVSYAALRSNFTATVGNWSEGANRHATILGADAHTETVATTRGTRIVQDTQRNFTNESGAEAWTLAQNVTVRNYTMSAPRSSLVADSGLDTLSELLSVFHLGIEGANGGQWRVFVYHDGTGVAHVKVVDPSDTVVGECTTTADPVRINVTNASVAGEHCAPMAFWDTIPAPYDLSYNKGRAIDGTYSLVVNETHDTVLASGHYHDSAGSGDPYVTYALYSADLRVTYRSSTVYYQTQIRVAPGEPDA